MAGRRAKLWLRLWLFLEHRLITDMNQHRANNAFSALIVTAAIIFTGYCKKMSAPGEPHAGAIVRTILETKRQLDCKDCLFLAFWDFDGTILKGDCSEGLMQDGRVIYRGLVEQTIEKGFSSVFRRNEAKAFFEEYRRRDETLGHKNSYSFLATQYAGADPTEIEDFARKIFESTYQLYYFQSSLQMLRGLQNSGIENHIVSASPEFFVRGAAHTLGLDPAQINGIRLQMADGKLTSRIAPPLTYAEGKTQRIQEIVQSIEKANPGKTVYILAGFGNSYHTDGPFLKFIQNQQFPAGKPVSVMINGGEAPPEFEGFWTVSQGQTQGGF